MAGEFAGKATFVKIDLTDNTKESKVAAKYDVTAMPATFIIKNGEVSGSVVGADADEIRGALEKAL